MSKKYPTPKRWYPKNPEKYVGDVNNIICRSSYEFKFFNYCDNNPSILKYASEEVVIPYYSKIDNKMHRYFVDAMIMVKTGTGEIKKYLVEIKPYAQTQPPKTSVKNQKRLIQEVLTWETNKAKWEAAKKFCEKLGMEFIILTERELLI